MEYLLPQVRQKRLLQRKGTNFKLPHLVIHKSIMRKNGTNENP